MENSMTDTNQDTNKTTFGLLPFDPVPFIAKELSISSEQIRKVVALFDEGNTIPFIARYRKEVTGNLDEVQIRDIQEKKEYIVALEDRRNTILNSLESQGKLTDELKEKVLNCDKKTALEDLYLPYKPKRRTKAMIAREKGLEPLAECILAQSMEGNPEKEAEKFIDTEKGVKDAAEALQGARHIVAEVTAENMDARSYVREVFSKEGMLVSKVTKENAEKATKWEQYYDFQEPIVKIPSHRFLAIKRGEKEGILSVSIEVDSENIICEILKIMNYQTSSNHAEQLKLAVQDAYKRLIELSIKMDVFVDLKVKADDKAIDVFAKNLETILLAAPLGEKIVIGVDPGLRTGCKCAAISSTGKFLDTFTMYLVGGEAKQRLAEKELIAFVEKYKPYAIAIGNGTGNRETEAFVKKVIKEKKSQLSDVKLSDSKLSDQGQKFKKILDEVIVVQVNEAGASVYSASDIAREEYPDLDLTIRGAISIASRLQDPLAEIVKVDPKSIGVGQYQHDVYQPSLEKKLHDVVESCVNRVGVELNTSSFSLLSYVAGIGPSLAKKIVNYRKANGAFSNREQLHKVPGLGNKAFKQSAGFLRIRNGENPLDSSAVHPERYTLVKEILKDIGGSLGEIIGDKSALKGIEKEKYISDDVGALTLDDIIDELQKPGRDPRSTFEPPAFRDDITTIQDLKEGMILEGIVTNVIDFGAFVDIGVHQDGLVHLSELSETFIKNPSDVVKTNDKIKVQVLSVDAERKRIALSACIGKRTKGEISKDSQNIKNLKGSKDSHTNKGFKGRGSRAQQEQFRKSSSKKSNFSSNPFSNL